MAPTRILMTTDAVGGVWNYSLRLAEALANYDVRFDLATMGPVPSAFQKQEAAALSNVTLHESTYQLEWMKDPWDDIARAGEWLLQLERQSRPDVVHLNGYSHGALPWGCIGVYSRPFLCIELVGGRASGDSAGFVVTLSGRSRARHRQS
jgi:glycogen synthase